MPTDPTVNQRIDELVADLRAKEESEVAASDENDAAQSAAQAAVATASSTLQAKNSAKDAFSASIDALVEYVQTLKA